MTLLLLLNPMLRPDYQAAEAYWRFRRELWITAPIINGLLADVYSKETEARQYRLDLLMNDLGGDTTRLAGRDPSTYPYELERAESARDVLAGTIFVVLDQQIEMLRRPFLGNHKWRSRSKPGEIPIFADVVNCAANNFRHWPEWKLYAGQADNHLRGPSKQTLATLLGRQSTEITKNVCADILEVLCPERDYRHLFDRFVAFAEDLVRKMDLTDERFPQLENARTWTFDSAIGDGARR